MDERLIESLAAAVRAAPDDLPLRLHLAGLLVEADRGAEAVEHVATALAKDPTSAQARELMARAMGTAPADADPDAAPAAPDAGLTGRRASGEAVDLRLARRRVRPRRDGGPDVRRRLHRGPRPVGVRRRARPGCGSPTSAG